MSSSRDELASPPPSPSFQPSRRDFIRLGVGAAGMHLLPQPLMGHLGRDPERIPPIDDPRLKSLVQTSLDAARSSGASYADTRLTYTEHQNYGDHFSERESLYFGVRVLVDGYWGFCACPIWSGDAAVRLAREAVRQAKANALGTRRSMTLAPVASAETGHWRMPVLEDPFTISRAEVEDYLESIRLFARDHRGMVGIGVECEFVRQHKAFGATDNRYFTQQLYRTRGTVVFEVKLDGKRWRAGLDTLTPAGAGFEHLRHQPVREQIAEKYEETKAEAMLPVKPVEVGRYDVVFGANGAANLVSHTVGLATELDRALGYEANAGGTSYVSDPRAMIGTLKMGAPQLTVHTNRSERGGAATVRWDDEGVTPRSITLVDAGILRGMQTDREGAGWLAEHAPTYAGGRQSVGCASAPDASFEPLTHTVNLQMQPGEDTLDFDALVQSIDRGVVLKAPSLRIDVQQMSGLGYGKMLEVRQGKIVAQIPTAGVLFKTTELWNSLALTGGSASARRFGFMAIKGQPNQRSYHSVTSVPMICKNLAVADVLRKA